MKISKRHIAKTFTWRLLGTFDTIILSWVITNDLTFGFKIGLLEVLSKSVLYYIHERIWFNSKMSSSNQRHVIKTFTWRGIGTIDTIIMAFIVTGNPLTGAEIGMVEVFTKMFLYFVHEKIWYKINYGLDQRNRRKRLNRIRQLRKI